jgi:membrane protease subunit HflK
VRFGKYERTADPGLNFKLPAPIERVYKVPVQRQLKEEFGFRTEHADVRTRYSNADFSDESLMLTGDLNVAVVSWTAQYRVRDPYKYLFKVRNVRKTFRDMNEAIMRGVVGDRSVDEALTVGRQEIQSEVEQRLQDLCDQYENGIVVDQIVLQNVDPPDPVKPSFNEVNQAEQERERAINDARADYNRIIPRARGEAEQTVAQAKGYASERVNRAQGDASLFEDMLAAYKRAPDVTRRRIYLETMQKIYPKVKQKVLLDENLKGVLPLLQLQPAAGQAQGGGK